MIAANPVIAAAKITRQPRQRGGSTPKNLLAALTKFIQGSGCFVVSPPGAKIVRVEIPKGSDLPVQLANYSPILCGTGTRVTSRGIMDVDIIELSLEK
jgi:hypothetical protein